jgi:hypothetical protein
MFPKAGLTSHWHHQHHAPARRTSWNAMKPRIQCVLAQWNPGFTASGKAAGSGPSGVNAAFVPDDLVWAVLELPEFTAASTPRST